MYRWFWLICVFTVLFSIGIVIYLEFDKRNFENSLPNVQHLVEQKQHEQHLDDTTHKVTVPSEDTVKKEVSDDYDWQSDDEAADIKADKDPWAQLSSLDADTVEDGSEEQYPPQGWWRTLDPELYAEYCRAQLIKQFSDVPQIESLADAIAVGRAKLRAYIPRTLDESIAQAEATYVLWPHEDTLRTIEHLHEIRASGQPYNPTYGPRIRPPENPVQHLEPVLLPLIKEYGELEGIRVFKTLDPHGAMELKHAMMQDAITVGETNPGYYEAKMKAIEEAFGDIDVYAPED